MADLVAAWSNINSGSYNLAGLERCATAITHEFHRLGGELRTIDLPPQEIIDAAGQIAPQPLGRAISITKRPAVSRRVLLAIHYDTVYGADHPFQTVTSIDPNTMRGPGVVDAKGGLVVLLTALEALERSDIADNLGWEVLLNPDEEIGSPGSSALFIEAAKRNRIGLIFEPALPDGSLVGSRKGSGNFTVVVRGRSAHAGRDPEKGRNAIVALAEFIVAMKTIAKSLPGVTINVGRIDGGGPVNIVPDLAIARFNLRVDNNSQQHKAETRIKELVDSLNLRDGISIQLHGSMSAPPKPLDEPVTQLLEQIAACGRDLGLSLQWRPSGGVCDGNRLTAAGLPTVDTLGPCGGNLHGDSEYLLLDSLVERAKLTALLLFKYATGKFSAPSSSMGVTPMFASEEHGRDAHAAGEGGPP